MLARNGVVADPAPPAARSLRLASISFHGIKRLEGRDVPFEFVWEGLGDGLWVIANADNLVGKSSVIQIVVWALRGTPKSWVPVVRKWLSRVEVGFIIDGRAVDVAFEVRDGVASGEVRIAGETAAQTFAGEESFKRVMQDFVMRPLGLEPIASSQARAGTDEVIRYDDGWLAFTGAFLSDTRSDAIIGENLGVNVTQKLLQVFLGLPWARLSFKRAQLIAFWRVKRLNESASWRCLEAGRRHKCRQNLTTFSGRSQTKELGARQPRSGSRQRRRSRTGRSVASLPVIVCATSKNF